MTILVIIIILSLVFDYINGFHDAANSIATIVSTKVLTPVQAVIWAAFFNFVAFFIFQEHGVANTIAKIVHKDSINLTVILSGIIAAIVWNLVTWWYGIPSSSSHTLIGGFAGAAIAHAGFNSIDMANISKVLIFIILAPLIGMLISIIITIITIQRKYALKMLIFGSLIFCGLYFIHFKKPFEKWGLASIGIIFLTTFTYIHFRKLNVSKTDKVYKKLQLFSSAIFSIGHGGSDAQKVMGIIAAALMVNGNIHDIKEMPVWVPISCYLAIAVGTMSGGWKIIKTMGTKITKLTPLEGVCAETAGAITLFTAANLGAPVSTTHTITGSIIGVGAIKRFSAVRWGVTINILWAWILTIPVSAILACLIYYVLRFFI